MKKKKLHKKKEKKIKYWVLLPTLLVTAAQQDAQLSGPVAAGPNILWFNNGRTQHYGVLLEAGSNAMGCRTKPY